MTFSAFRNTSPRYKARFTFFITQLTTSIALPIPVVGATCMFLVSFLMLLSINFYKHSAEAVRSCAQPRLICKDVLAISQVRFHLFPLRISNYFQSDLFSNGCCDPGIIKLFIKFVTLFCYIIC